jgi:hypothetical protein
MVLVKLVYIGYYARLIDAGWSSLVARRAHNPKVVGSNPAPATNFQLVNQWPTINCHRLKT